MIVIRELDSVTKTRIRVGEPFIVELEENPTTGYCWATAGDRTVFEVRSSSFESARAGCGGAGRRKLEIVVRRAGESILRFELRRPWEAPGSAIETREIRVDAGG